VSEDLSKMPGIEETIQQAMQDGAFDNLPGKGKPLNLEESPFIDPEWQLAYHLLKQNGFAPQFIEVRQAIEVELAAARQALARSWVWSQRALARGEDAVIVETEWGSARGKFEDLVKALNLKIKTYNLAIPISKLYRNPIDAARDIQDIQAQTKK
jgi:DnaJ family protein C protein 28